MFPLDSEFLILYLLYFTVFGYFFVQYFRTKKRVYKINLIIFISYFILMVYVFADKENFKYGNSLAVLFYGILFLTTHIILYGIINFIKYCFQKRT